MKLLYITGIFSTKYGGFEKYTIELAKQQNIDLSIIYNAEPTSKEYLNDLQKFNVRLYVIKGNILQRAFQVYKIIRKEKPDILHYHFGFLVYFLFLFVKIFHPNVGQVLTQHCEFNYTNKIFLLCSKLCYNTLDYVLSVSEGVKLELVNKLGNRSHYIVHYLGVAKEDIKNQYLRASLGISQDEIVITSIGFDVNVKGFDLLVQSIYELKKEKNIPKFKVIIIGLNGSEFLLLQNMIKHYCLEDDIISVGIRNDIDDFLYFTDIYVQPSRTEAISLSIMEALLYGIPIIGSNVGGIPEVCISGQNGELFEKNNYIQLKKMIVRLLLDGNLREKYGEKSLELSKKYSRLSSVKTLFTLYESVIKK